MEILQKQIHRAELDTTKYYIQMKNEVSTYIGKFIRAYRMGSGDGMTLHLEFNNNGNIVTVDEEMWGSISGNELSYFIETQPAPYR